jgi:hypothetical protein
MRTRMNEWKRMGTSENSEKGSEIAVGARKWL